jgi:cytochrome c-type biogenesis protein CcmF
VGAPFYNAVACRLAVSAVSDRRWSAAAVAGYIAQGHQAQLCLPSIALWGTGGVCLAVGVRPWKDGALDQGNLYALVAFAISAAVLTAILSEFLRGARVICQAERAESTLRRCICWFDATRGAMAAMSGSHRRCHCVIGLAGSAFNRNVEGEMALHGKLNHRALHAGVRGLRRRMSNANYDSEYAVLDVYENGAKRVFQMTPEKRVYLASVTAANDGGDSLRSGMGSLCGLSKASIQDTESADHQSVSESAGELDLGWDLRCSSGGR